MVPNGWVTKDLRSISLLITKGSTPTTYGHEFVEQSENSIRFVGAYNCSFDGKFKSDSEKWISKEADELLKRSKLNDKDCIICIVGNTIGSNFLVSKEIIPANINQNVAIIRADERKVNSRYLHYWIMSPYIQYQVQQEASTQAQPSLSLKQVGDFTIALPPLNEQNRIAKILSTWDKAISTTEQLLANSQQQKKALMQQLLTGKKRLNGYSEAFKRYHFSDLLEIDSKSLGTKTDPDFEFDYISLSDVELGKIGSVLEHHVYKNAPSRARRIVKAGDILLSTVRPNLQGFAKISNPHENCIASTGFSVLTPQKGTCGDYIYHYLFSAHITGQINSLVVGTNYPAINSSDVSGLCIYCPCYDEQVKIAAFLNNSDATIIALQQKLDALKQEKKALMQQLLTGKRRVKIN
ncbi:TPA: restriction endonuclease subunit S [Aeromonas veronii]